MVVYQNCPECGQRDGMIEMPFNVQGFCDGHRLIWEMRRKTDGKPVPTDQKQHEWKVHGSRAYLHVGPHAPDDGTPSPVPASLAGEPRLTVTFHTGAPTPRSPGDEAPFTFDHGFGDVVSLAASIPLYTRRGRTVRVWTEPEYRELLRAAGAEVLDDSEKPATRHAWLHAEIPQRGDDWLIGNKAWNNVSAAPMPDIGRDTSLWDEYRSTELFLEHAVGNAERLAVESLMYGLPRPLIVFHPQGRPPYELRSLREETTLALYDGLLRKTGGSVVVLDLPTLDFFAKHIHGEPTPIIESDRVRSVMRHLQRPTTVMELFWLLNRADLFIGVDSGPAHFSRFARKTPAIVCWGRPERFFGCPSLLFIPRRNTTHIVTASDNPFTSPPPDQYNPRVSPGRDRVDPQFVADIAAETLRAPVAVVRVPRNEAAFRPVTILMRREGTPGDVLVASGTVAAIKKRHPRSTIIFQTLFPDVLARHPLLDRVVGMDEKIETEPDLKIEFGHAVDAAPNASMLEAFCGRASVSAEECDWYMATDAMPGLPDAYCAMHIGPVGSKWKWVGRDWFPERFNHVSRWLALRGIRTVLVGDARKNDSGLKWPSGTVDLRGRTTMAELAYVIRHSRLFVGLDSFPMHIAQALNVPGVCFFGSILPSLRIFRENMIGAHAAELPCIGCHHRSTSWRDKGTCETSVCAAGDEPCRDMVSAVEIIHHAERILA